MQKICVCANIRKPAARCVICSGLEAASVSSSSIYLDIFSHITSDMRIYERVNADAPERVCSAIFRYSLADRYIDCVYAVVMRVVRKQYIFKLKSLEIQWNNNKIMHASGVRNIFANPSLFNFLQMLV